jgi:uncharacterized protein (TIGR02246 family)
MTRKALLDLTRRFVEAFNRLDLDAVMEFFADDAVYDEFNGRRNHGREAIRAVLTPQFTGAFGQIQFLDEDLFIDDEAGKVMASWRCTLVVKGQPTSWRGLDLLHFGPAGKVTQKLTYAKAKVPLFED